MEHLKEITEALADNSGKLPSHNDIYNVWEAISRKRENMRSPERPTGTRPKNNNQYNRNPKNFQEKEQEQEQR